MKKNLSVNSNIVKCSKAKIETLYQNFNSSYSGLSQHNVENQKKLFGSNEIKGKKKDTFFYRLKRAFINPFSIVLLILTFISFLTDVVFAANSNKNFATVIIILIMLFISGIVRFIQEIHAKKIADSLTNLTNTIVNVKRDNKWQKINSEKIVVGDIIKLESGERVPADIRLINSNNCFVSQSVITGESEITKKGTQLFNENPAKINDLNNILFQGTSLNSGYCEGIVIAVGNNTFYGGFSAENFANKNGFNRGANSIAWVLIKFMVILVPIVFIASGITKNNWGSAFLFALSVAVGLTPELLPMVITACLAKGSFNMGQKKTIIKNINAMQSFGSMDILCVDKTGTLTGDSLQLEYYMDILGNEDSHVLDCAFLNSAFSKGFKNHIDNAILKLSEIPNQKDYFEKLTQNYKKINELPFDYNRKISSVLLDNNNEYLLIAKGDIDSILSRCKYVYYKGKLIEKEDNVYNSVHNIIDEMLEDGMKVLAIAVKRNQSPNFNFEDENDLILLGYIAFFDSPKESAITALEKLKNLNVKTKVLSGDNIKVTLSICKRLGIDNTNFLTGEELDKLDDNEIQIRIENTSVFAELSPKQKGKIISLLKSNGHSVGFLGDGMNDLPALLEADVGISVDNAVKSAKEMADVILLKKDLNVLEEGILEGRKSFANMTKYIKITASSNLGNIFAIVLASIFLPFFPMTSIQILLLNLLYDILCLVLPWDNVDEDMYEKPLEWSGQNLSSFMLYFAPTSSIFDIITFGFLYFILCPLISGGSFLSLPLEGQSYFISLFHTGWFLESMWTQVLIINLLRTKESNFLKNPPAKPVAFFTLLGILVFTILTMTPLSSVIGLTSLPLIYFIFLIIIVICYMTTITLMKKIYIKRYKRLI